MAEAQPVAPTQTACSTKSKSRLGIWFITGLLLLLAVATGAFFLGKYGLPTWVSGKKICTLEAKVCPDGSYVGRTDPNCEFAPCPSPTSTPSIGYTCPDTEWADCMPGPNMGVKQECTPEFINWAKIHCPDFKGPAY
ncbi:hypothetical protein KKB64_05070 [Patescibacteria group bacterium]|nr:hypothetical protein [Patescibacteria group bacterium]MBU1473123.1 hypothetical protein [Patescibacteria group bacterium]MBU2459659.1 hypothetical protein [Patescibacteria group bacterium]MBU2544438.1 hypothetical protein [Patescibacteria group bacterium]